ncbi:hypothetical protein C8J57DRAFT_1220497 [Mycena rebaudengoi]|nr:hypothetical protein C8J57DRAFT_1220497 [Mycena rebaudengoi]
MVAGKIILEEAFNLPEWAEMSAYQASLFTVDGDGRAHADRLVDIHAQRLAKMDAHDVEFSVLSLTAPGIQDFFDPAEAAQKAAIANDWVAGQVQENPKRFGAFAALAMHDPHVAAKELTRCVKELGFLGALVNDTQRGGADGDTPIFYDGPEWDVFWKTVTDLDVPFYLHPIAPKGTQFEKYWQARSARVGPCMSFANGVAAHLMGMVVNGVFDRHPTLKVIIGHLGEKIPIDLWRISHWLEDVHKPRGAVKMQRTLREYFASNIWLTTSGNFDTNVLKYVVSEVGASRIMFSVDYPYETFELACEWFDGLKPDAQLSETDLQSIARDKAVEVLKLRL